MSNNLSWLTQTDIRSGFGAPTLGFGMGDVCPKGAYAGICADVTPMRKRHADATQATWVSALMPWSPPVT